MLRIGAWRVDSALDEISRDGQTVKLEPKLMRLLVCLAEHAGQVVSVDQLLNEVWKDVIVTSDSVYHAVAALRRLLGDDAKEPVYIANVLRRGYRLIAPVAPVDALPVAHPNQPAAAEQTPRETEAAARPAAAATGLLFGRSAIVLLVASALFLAYLVVDRFWLSEPVTAGHSVTAALTTVSDKSIAVLPFVNMSDDKNNEYFSDGLSEELIDLLTKVPDLHVAAHTSSFYFKGKQTTIADIAKALGVTHVLEGSVRKSGNHLRIAAQLVRADNGYHLWSETYDRQLDDIFKVQDEIAVAVVKALKISLMGRSLPASTGTQNIEAYNLFLQARSMWRHANERADYERVAECLRSAVDADPQFANAWALLSRALIAEAVAVRPPDQKLIEEARRIAKHALQLNSTLPYPHLAYAAILWGIDFDVRDAEAQIQQALELDPNSPEALHWSLRLPMYRGHFDTALEFAQKSIAIDPVVPSEYLFLGTIYYFAGRYPEALAAIRKMPDLDPGTHSVYHENAAFFLLAKGDPAAALTEIDSDKDVRDNSSILVLAYDALGRKAEADAALANMEKHHAANKAYEIGLVYANRGELDRAFVWFDRAYRQRDTQLFNLKVSPRTKNLRSDPRFNALLGKLDLLD